MLQPEFLARLASSQRILIAGAGGGFDVYSGLPLALALIAAGKTVHLANLSFTSLDETKAPFLVPHLAAVTPDVTGANRYFPERTLARWLHDRGLGSTIYAFEKVGVRPLRFAYQTLCDRLELDAILLIDGGTDILMFGDEAGLGTPAEDMTSLAAVAGIELPVRLVACLGFGVDAHSGICHAHFLENVATLERDGAYLGACSFSRSSPEGTAYLDAVEHAQLATPKRPSIVNASIAAALRGEFGNVALGSRTANSELFINPLMNVYFGFDLPGLARRNLYLERLRETETIQQVWAIIDGFRKEIPSKERRVLPL